jgi:2-dehydro-3-deoxy-D-arabinonate dehydratase
MKLGRFLDRDDDAVRVGVVLDATSEVLDLTPAGITAVQSILEEADPAARVERLAREPLARRPLADVRVASPIERQEVWAAGVTYLRSRTARMEESDFSASAYDRVYEAERPELFFKSAPEKVVAPGDPVGIRRDARWNVPEPELALVLNSRGAIVGYTAGNDMSSRDIEGENLLYLPQAKVYHRSCAVGPWIAVGAPEAVAREWTVRLDIQRAGRAVFTGETSVGNIKRGFQDLAAFLFRSQVFPHGAVLLTGTGIVPPDTFTLEEGDLVAIDVSGIGILRNPVVVV